MKPIIRSVKHYIQTPAAGVASGAVFNRSLVRAIAKDATVTATEDVEEGSIIKAVYVEYWVKADNPNFTVSGIVYKRPGGVGTIDFTATNNLQAEPNKKNIFEFHQGLAPSGDQTLALFRHWIKIPKGKQRFGLDDKLQITIAFTGSAGDVCGFATYKEYE